MVAIGLNTKKSKGAVFTQNRTLSSSHQRQLYVEDRGREGLTSSPPSELCMRFSRTQLSSR